jgi:pSer/pThr/pTyr-binding forkhead associated (FHA) protein
MTIGRGAECDLALGWDSKVSRVHAELRRVGGEWLLIDNGSRNGTFLNEAPLVRRQRLKPLDQIRVGSTAIVFRSPVPVGTTSTDAADVRVSVGVTPAQRRVLVALCQPYEEGASSSSPATNRQIADELFLSVPAVKTHLRALFRLFELDHLPQNEKRARLAKLAIATGTVTSTDLRR